MRGEGSWVNSWGGIEENKCVGGRGGVELYSMGDGVERYLVLEHNHGWAIGIEVGNM